MNRQRFFLTCLFIIFLVGCSSSVPTPLSSPTAIPSPSPTITPMPVCNEAQGHFEFHEIQTSHMTHPLSLRIYLPACYGADASQRYPVLYLLHGQSFRDDQWDRLGADETLDSLLAADLVPPFIIVMPKESNYSINQWDSKYGPALAEDLVPWVDAHYQTKTERVYRAIGGISRGAGWAMRTALIYWQVYSIVGAHSFAPFRGDFNAAPLWIREIPTGELPSIWIDVGDRDFIKDAARVWKNRLDDYDVPHEWHILPGAHDEIYWSSQVDTYLRWYASHWQ